MFVFLLAVESFAHPLPRLLPPQYWEGPSFEEIVQQMPECENVTGVTEYPEGCDPEAIYFCWDPTWGDSTDDLGSAGCTVNLPVSWASAVEKGRRPRSLTIAPKMRPESCRVDLSLFGERSVRSSNSIIFAKTQITSRRFRLPVWFIELGRD